jgi:REP element-mobilizing transposase RayT
MTQHPEASGSRERQRVDSAAPLKRHLPRLSPEFYRGHAFVHWTLTIERRATGWLTPAFHHTWQLTLLHTCARYSLACPIYVLMPDHVHLLWLGFSEDSDQLLAIEFLRKHLRLALAPADWQRQPHDNVLRVSDREHSAFQLTAQYILENPVRAGLAIRWSDYAFLGCCIAGYPEFDPRMPDYWERFWRCYNHLIGQHTP